MYMESGEMVLVNLLAGQQWRRRRKEQTRGHVGEGEGGTNGESSREKICITTCKIEASGNLL